MPLWYYCFVAMIALIAWHSTECDRRAAVIVAAATAAGIWAYGILSGFESASWKLAVYAGIEAATFIALVVCGGRSCYWQASSVFVAWVAHLLCWVDIHAGTSVIYGTYENALALVALAQIAGFHDTLLQMPHAMRDAFTDAVGRIGRCAVFRASGLASILRH